MFTRHIIYLLPIIVLVAFGRRNSATVDKRANFTGSARPVVMVRVIGAQVTL
jgi:hypothetical protein